MISARHQNNTMRLYVNLFSLFSLFALFTLRPTVAETPGVCTVTQVKEKPRYVMDRSKNAWKLEMYRVATQREECCSGYRAQAQGTLSCVPVCDPPCENSDCMAPDTCVCHPGHFMINNSSSSCFNVCDSCVNGECLSADDTECTCSHGYSRDPTFPHICHPICSPQCINATCIKPSICECYDGFKEHPDKSLNHICVPHCFEKCVFGTCTEPEVCTCFDGYINDKDSPSICLPVCNHTCVNGDCYAPDMCKCREGFELHPMDPYQCLPQAPEDSSWNSCKIKIPQAVRYDKDSDCFLIKEQITVSVASHCGVIESQSGSFCSHPDNCLLNQCVSNFRCFLISINNSNEMHCTLEEDEFETDSADISSITNTTGWTDIVLVVNAYRHSNASSEAKQNVTKEMILHPSIKGPICRSMHFAAEIRECELPVRMSRTNDHINSSFMFWMNVFLICGFLLLVGAGVGGFLWARQRRLNDPLNYRGDMIQGYYNNGSYDNQPAELVSDDDSDRYSDAPL